MLTPSELRRHEPVELVCAVGVTRRFPLSMVTAPHGSRVAFVHPAWMHDDEVILGLFGRPGGLTINVRWQAVPYQGGQIGDLEPATDWDAIAKQGPDEPDGGELVEARLLIVAGPRRVFVEADPDATAFVVEPRAPQGTRVRRENVGQLAIGDFVLLRDHYGRDDSIRHMADQLLGADAPRLRLTQETWKRHLRDLVDAEGFGKVSADLASMGVKARNLRGWLSSDAIRPALAKDFRLAMEYVGLGAQVPAAWDELGRIDRAHLQAGQRFRKMLEDEIERTDLAALLEMGEMSVALDTEGMGSLGIYRVEEAAPETMMVPISWLKVASPIDRDLWQG